MGLHLEAVYGIVIYIEKKNYKATVKYTYLHILLTSKMRGRVGSDVPYG